MIKQNITPEQMRALAEQHAERASWESIGGGKRWYENTAAVLRAAADQLEAVHRWNWRHEGTFADDELEAILTADTAPRRTGDE